MAEVQLKEVDKIYEGGVHAVQDLSLDVAGRRVRRARRARPAAARRRRCAWSPASRRSPTATITIGDRVVNDLVAEGSRHRDGVPELRALPAPDRRREHRLRRCGCGRRRRTRSTERIAWAAKLLDLTPYLDAQAARALRRPAAARRDGPRDRARAAGVPDGRAALEPRREAARADARRDREAPARARRRRRSTSRTTRSRR